jgi:hypothetical protein
MKARLTRLALAGLRHSTLALAAATLALAAALWAAIPHDAVEAHKYADGVLMPRFTAAVNDYAYQHPQDKPGREWEHCARLDAGDMKRWRLVREAFKELDQAMKRAGY